MEEDEQERGRVIVTSGEGEVGRSQIQIGGRSEVVLAGLRRSTALVRRGVRIKATEEWWATILKANGPRIRRRRNPRFCGRERVVIED
jgi:hypothetical protein